MKYVGAGCAGGRLGSHCLSWRAGGIDRVYSTRFGRQLQDRLRDRISREWDGELPIGLAVLVATGDADIPYLISAPTMRAPVSIANTLHPYLSFRAVLRVVQGHNEQNPGGIKAVACPGLGTGTGAIPPALCARQMREAYDEVIGGKPFQPSGLNDALMQQQRLLHQEQCWDPEKLPAMA